MQRCQHPEIGRIQTNNREVFKITCNFSGIKFARNRGAEFGCQNGQNCLQKYSFPSEIGRVGISGDGINSSQLAKMKKYIPHMSLPLNL